MLYNLWYNTFMKETNETKKVQILIDEKGLTRRSLAKRLDIDEAKLNMWFSRKSIPKEWLKPTASALGVTVDFILD
jgi:hypothetical protein